MFPNLEIGTWTPDRDLGGEGARLCDGGIRAPAAETFENRAIRVSPRAWHT